MNQGQIKQLVLDCIDKLRQSELNSGSYDVKSSLYALSSVYSLVDSHEMSADLSAEASIDEYIKIMYDFQCHYRKNPIDSDEYGGGGAVVGSVISEVFSQARESGVEWNHR